MQYLLLVIDDTTGRTDAELETGTATPDEMAAIDVFNERMQQEGSWVFAAGLAAPKTARTVDNRGGKKMVTDGPFAESKEFIAGFWIVEAASDEAALALASDGSRACNRKIDVRPIR